MQRLSLAVVRLLEPGDLGAEIGLLLPALEDLDLGLAFGIRLLPIAGGIGRGGAGRLTEQQGDGQEPDHRSALMPHKDLRNRRAIGVPPAVATSAKPLSPCPYLNPARPTVFALWRLSAGYRGLCPFNFPYPRRWRRHPCRPPCKLISNPPAALIMQELGQDRDDLRARRRKRMTESY